MKAAPIYSELKKCKCFQPIIVHTGQHYDRDMSDVFFRDLGMPEPDIYLGVGSASHAVQTAKIMEKFEPVCLREKPDLVMVVGDVNSTIACALTAVKLGIKIAHVEAGLRSFDRTMPEEINRLLTDQISDYLFTTCKDADRNLVREGIAKNKIFFVGNVMIDTLKKLRAKSPLVGIRSPRNNIEDSEHSDEFPNVLSGLPDIAHRVYKNYKLHKKQYALVTLHRPSNVDDSDTFKGIMSALQQIARRITVIFPVHPRTMKMLTPSLIHRTSRHPEQPALSVILTLNNVKGKDPKKEEILRVSDKTLRMTSGGVCNNIIFTKPLGYLEFMNLMADAALVLTDSGGIQEETTILGVPCLTLRNNTERPITITEGTNKLVGTDPTRIVKESKKILAKVGMLEKYHRNHFAGGKKRPMYWDGKAASRIIKILIKELR
jgi:UDP-N-acetylglucosamine 2-epimerase (non-hydrolysing)